MNQETAMIIAREIHRHWFVECGDTPEAKAADDEHGRTLNEMEGVDDEWREKFTAQKILEITGSEVGQV